MQLLEGQQGRQLNYAATFNWKVEKQKTCAQEVPNHKRSFLKALHSQASK